MVNEMRVLVAVLCMLSNAGAATVSIGNASARGNLQVDSYLVKGNATLFDGSVVETGQASADLRLDLGTEILMSTESRATLYRDRVLLQKGESELAASSTYRLDAIGLRVTPNEPNSRGVVSLKSENTVEVAALSGSFAVTSDLGATLATVRPGHALLFDKKSDQGGAVPAATRSGLSPRFWVIVAASAAAGAGAGIAIYSGLSGSGTPPASR